MSTPCSDEVCLTCADHAVPAVVSRLCPDDLALVLPADAGATGAPCAAQEISVALVDAAVGDTVLVHAGEAIAVLSRAGQGADDDHR